jgi:transmembrane sensor
LEQYRDLTAEELLNEPFFRHWLTAPDAETNQSWNQFLLDYPEKQKTVLTARAMFKALRQSQAEPSVQQGSVMWERIRAETEKVAHAGSRSLPPFKFMRIGRLMAAASIFLLIGFAGWRWMNPGLEEDTNTYAQQTTDSALPLMEQQNPGPEPREILLPDGSQVLLYPSGRLSYQAHFSGGNRTVYLSGKARFNVVKDDTKPFLVYANDLVTQVVGTSFTVNSPSATALATVMVESGKVKVFTIKNFRKEGRGLEADVALLTPNQQVTYDPAKALLTKTVVAEPGLLNVPTAYPDFDFDNTAATRVFNTLGESYGVTIRYDAKTIQDCSVTAPLGNEPLFKKLDIICQTIGATYEVWGTEIVVKGPGCGQ